jgi:3-hydroxyisobutyrate dehydrogenase
MCTALPSIGFIGLGIMGLPMVKHLGDAGYQVTVYNRTKSKVEQAKRFGANEAASPRLLAERSDVLITMLTDPAAVCAVTEGPEGAFANPKKGLVWIQMSTIDIESTKAFAQAAKAHGMTYVDCPVTGSKKQVEAAELILLAGAEPEALAYVRPILSRLGKTIIHAGSAGAGTALKLCMNLIVAQMTTALAEAVALAETTGINPELIFQTVRASPALNCGYFQIKEQALLKKDFSPAFSLDNLAKDVGFMVSEAKSRGVDLPVTEAVQKLLQKARAEDLGSQDVAAVYLALADGTERGALVKSHS